MIHDALVIGAGPAGSTAAFLLAKGGWSVAVVEKRRFPRPKVCGEYVSATNAGLFDALGLGAAFRRAAGPEIRRVGLFAKDAFLTAPMPSAHGAADGWGRALSREILDALLLERARSAGAEIWEPYAAVELRAERGHHACRIAAAGVNRILRARVVVAAHGSWEPGPLPSQCARPHRAADLLAFKARFRGCVLEADLMPLLAFPGGYGGLVQSDGGHASLSLCIRRDALQRIRKASPGLPAGPAVLGHVLAHCRAARASLDDSSVEGRWLSAGPIRPGIRPAYAADVFRVGNAAGEAHPIIADGISMAMQSALLLARHLTAAENALSSEDDRRQVGAAYRADWRQRFAMRIRAAGLFAALAMRERSPALLLPLLRAFPELLTFGAKLSGKTAPLDASFAAGH
ncbi:MAG TPA: NAD(P)/FAD-dependent oxidoreductase [Gammaproteobacteria bacterium]